MTKEQISALPNVLRVFKAPSKLVAAAAVLDMRELTGASEYHISYCWNVDNEDDVEIHIGANTESDLDTRILACRSILNRYSIA